MLENEVVAAIRAHDDGRDPVRLAMRYHAMRSSPFAFLRATCPLYYAHAQERALLPDAPIGWLCGDLHLENFGSFRGANGLAYFDLNDFDEAVLAPGTWDILRLATSIMIWAKERHGTAANRRAHGKLAVDAFTEALRGGRARWVERVTAEGPVRKLLRQVAERTRRLLLTERTVRRGGSGVRRLLLDPAHTLPVTREEREQVTRCLTRFGAGRAEPRFFHVVDVARRVAGLGSLGLPRWVVLVEGKGPPNGHRLLDVKAARPSSVAAVLATPQPEWRTDAARIVDVQHWLQAETPALLSPVTMGKQAYLLQQLQPEKDRLRLGHLNRNPEQIASVLHTMGHLAAWSLLRGTGRRGAAVVDEWIDFAHRAKWQREIMSRAQALAKMVDDDWRRFASGYDAGEFGT